MTAKNEAALQTPFTVTIEAREGVTTGFPRTTAPTRCSVAVDPNCGPDDLVQPGHVYPLRAKRGRRAGARRPHRGGRRPRAPGRAEPGRRDLRDHERGRRDGPGARPRRLLRGARAEDDHDRRPDRVPAPHERLVERVVADAPADRLRRFEAVGYRSLVDDKHHVALVKGDVAGKPTCSCACTRSA